MTEKQAILVAAIGCALVKMKSAGLADFGSVPKDPELLADKAEVYAEALEPTGNDPLAIVIDAECIEHAARRFCRMPAVKPGERNSIPDSGEFARVCREVWGEIYRHVGVPVMRGELEVSIVVAIRRDASEEQVSATIARTRSLAIGAGRQALPSPAAAPIPTDEVRARMHEMLGWEAPRG